MRETKQDEFPPYFLTMTMTSLWNALFYHRNDYTPRPNHGRSFFIKGQKNMHGFTTFFYFIYIDFSGLWAGIGLWYGQAKYPQRLLNTAHSISI